MNQNKTNFTRTSDWLAACGKEPNEKNLSLQFGCHLEELMEQIDEVILVGSVSDNESLEMAATRIKGIAHRLKTGATGIRIKNREKFLDALCDGEVTGNGVAFMANMDKNEADRRVLATNDMKLVNGKPVLSPGGKIMKPPGWVAPYLGDCV
ncbi:hypothetical protein ICN24_05720 [Polynucleobacter sp. UK-Kesae-W10]|nr:hypothetical protein [Polynucleobacter sp. UK-Kesae-W10]